MTFSKYFLSLVAFCSLSTVDRASSASMRRRRSTKPLKNPAQTGIDWKHRALKKVVACRQQSGQDEGGMPKETRRLGFVDVI